MSCLVISWWHVRNSHACVPALMFSGVVQASGKAKQKMAAVVDADSEAELAASDSDFEPGMEAEPESEVASSPSAWLEQVHLGSSVGMPSLLIL